MRRSLAPASGAHFRQQCRTSSSSTPSSASRSPAESGPSGRVRPRPRLVANRPPARPLTAGCPAASRRRGLGRQGVPQHGPRQRPRAPDNCRRKLGRRVARERHRLQADHQVGRPRRTLDPPADQHKRPTVLTAVRPAAAARSNGAALPEQGDITQVSTGQHGDTTGVSLSLGLATPTPPPARAVQVGKPNTRGSLIVDTARSRRLLGKTAAAFLATPKAHDIVLEPTCFRYHRLKARRPRRPQPSAPTTQPQPTHRRPPQPTAGPPAPVANCRHNRRRPCTR